MFAFSLEDDTDLTISVEQEDKKAHLEQPDYQFSYIRMTVAKIAPESEDI